MKGKNMNIKKHYFYVGYKYSPNQYKYKVFLWGTNMSYYLDKTINWKKFSTYEEAEKQRKKLNKSLYLERRK